MRILLASSELFPYSKTGGLSDMVGALAKFLAQSGQEVSVVTPLYRGIREKHPEMTQLDWQLELPMGEKIVTGEVWTLKPAPRLKIYFIDQPEFYDRPSLYQEKGVDYPDNAERFIFFAKAAVNLARYLPAPPELVHVHDWQAGLIPILMLHQRWRDGWRNSPKTVLTIHNLAYQGGFAASDYPLTNLAGDYFNPDGVEFYGGLNCLKAGIAFADAITTVSPRYAEEITTKEFGCGMEGLLLRRKASLTGILNGVDYTEWRTSKNPHLPHSFTITNLKGKQADKLALQKEMGLPENAAIPLFGNISRLVEDKGSGLIITALEEMLAADMQFVQLGSGNPALQNAFQELATRFPDKVAVKIGYDHSLAHRIEAACDFYLMPSRYEPCGLNQMYSLRYGAIPVVHATGGLDDTVVDATEDLDLVNGIKFNDYTPRALAKAIRKALTLYAQPDWLDYVRQNGMNADHSWRGVVDEYLRLYERTLASP